MNRRKYNYNGN